MKRLLLLVCLFSAVAAAYGQGPASPPLVPLTFPDGSFLKMEIARTATEQTRGLMFRTFLPEDHGMLFIFKHPGNNRFWMKNTLIPLDIIWMDEKKKIIHIEYQVPPCKMDPCPVYGPTTESLYVLEVNAGVAQRRDLQVGTRLHF
jgi:uncharacterized protein